MAITNSVCLQHAAQAHTNPFELTSTRRTKSAVLLTMERRITRSMSSLSTLSKLRQAPATHDRCELCFCADLEPMLPRNDALRWHPPTPPRPRPQRPQSSIILSLSIRDENNRARRVIKGRRRRPSATSSQSPVLRIPNWSEHVKAFRTIRIRDWGHHVNVLQEEEEEEKVKAARHQQQRKEALEAAKELEAAVTILGRTAAELSVWSPMF